MKLSMWILADWLQKYHPVAEIENGEPILRSARILSADTRIEPQNVYLAPAREFISGEGEKILCVQGHDILLLDTMDMDAVLNDIFDAFDYYNSWADGLVRDIENGCKLQHLVDMSGPVFREPIAVFDASHLLIARSQEYGPASVDDEWDVVIRTGSNSLDILNKMKEHLYRSRYSHEVQALSFPYFSTRSFQKMLFYNRTVIGRIILLEFERPEGTGTMQLLDTLGSLMELWMSRSREKQVLRAECDIFRDILDGSQVSALELEHKLTMVGWEKEHEKILLKLEIPPAYQDITYPLLSRLEKTFQDCYVFLHYGCIFILADLYFTEEKYLETELSALLRQSVFHCAVSYPFFDVLKLRIPAEQCSLILRFASHDRGGIYHCRDYALELIRNILHTQVDHSIIHPALGLLRENDAKDQNGLYQTLYVYLSENCSLAHTAERLNLHRNSLLYRLNKIKSLSGLDLKDQKTREYLYLSYLVEGKTDEGSAPK